jgi:hypothetical protein
VHGVSGMDTSKRLRHLHIWESVCKGLICFGLMAEGYHMHDRWVHGECRYTNVQPKLAEFANDLQSSSAENNHAIPWATSAVMPRHKCLLVILPAPSFYSTVAGAWYGIFAVGKRPFGHGRLQPRGSQMPRQAVDHQPASPPIHTTKTNLFSAGLHFPQAIAKETFKPQLPLPLPPQKPPREC